MARAFLESWSSSFGFCCVVVVVVVMMGGGASVRRVVRLKKLDDCVGSKFCFAALVVDVKWLLLL